MYTISVLLYIFLGLLLIDGVIELAFISSMVGWLHRRAGKTFDFYWDGTSGEVTELAPAGVYSISGRPANLYVNQGHTSNGAAGTAIVIVGLGGILVLCLRRFSPKTFRSGFGTALYTIWRVFTILSALLSLTALIYTFILHNKYAGESISVNTAANGATRTDDGTVVDGPGKPYPSGYWTPEIWFASMLKEIHLIHDSDRADIELRLATMRGWRWNLIPLTILGFVVAGLAWTEAFKRKESSSGTARYQPTPKQEAQFG